MQGSPTRPDTNAKKTSKKANSKDWVFRKNAERHKKRYERASAKPTAPAYAEKSNAINKIYRTKNDRQLKTHGQKPEFFGSRENKRPILVRNRDRCQNYNFKLTRKTKIP
jgi:hypothetical protein